MNYAIAKLVVNYDINTDMITRASNKEEKSQILDLVSEKYLDKRSTKPISVRIRPEPSRIENPEILTSET